jgi:hypothetical protein
VQILNLIENTNIIIMVSDGIKSFGQVLKVIMFLNDFKSLINALKYIMGKMVK